ncbi:hypothetical protein Harman_20510 [Haloarcula mannanilytica]|uniref:Uncharacterized protein n=1 Tax=Haloarcula mannanilytica TaxID=2509225 RepID=A0A4C2EI89_9EURY|nr:hypothetical protein [Haloarcula mannanilytica]GCF14116.1 hypothetical protein Harman_20510 [Haloarcula mannanilytica]
MPDRVPSDHETIETHRVPVESVGRTDRPRVVLPTALDLTDGDTVRLALDGDQYHAVVETNLDSEPVISHVADNRRLARERDGTNRLAEWIADSDVSLGGSAHLDVVTDGTEYGLRTPGKRVVYAATDGPDSSLSDIARNLDN